MVEAWLVAEPRSITTEEIVDECNDRSEALESNRPTCTSGSRTLAQVRHNQESTERQYALRDKALALGWTPPTIRTLDRDLGVSGAQSAGR